jgi:FG-GAP-like repeat
MTTPSSRFLARVFGFTASCLLPTAYYAGPPAYSQEFDRTVIDASFSGAYQVEVADVNGDKKPDIIAVGGSTCAWYENPTWKKRVVTGGKLTPGIISSATADIDGDGKAEIAIAYVFAMNTPTTGKLLLAEQGRGLDDPWKLLPIADIGSIHRLRWGDINGDKQPDLVIAPIFGPRATPPIYDDPARLIFFDGREHIKSGKTRSHLLATRPVMHSIEVADAKKTGSAHILTADNLGVGVVRLISPGHNDVIDLVAGAKGDAPKRGCSEVHLGQLRGGKYFLATLEPWHGNQVAVYQGANGAGEPASFPPRDLARAVIDDTLADGHALWVADVDGDGDDEVFAGHRGKDHRVSMYDLDRTKNTWTRTVLDREVAAQDLRGGDIDGDGAPDVVTVGGSTHNVVWYHFRRH